MQSTGEICVLDIYQGVLWDGQFEDIVLLYDLSMQCTVQMSFFELFDAVNIIWDKMAI